MSLEQQVETLNENVVNLTNVIRMALEQFAHAAPATQGKSKKSVNSSQVIPQQPTAAELDEAGKTVNLAKPMQEPKKLDGYLLEGDPVGTRYFVIESHNTAYKQLPGDADCTFQGALIVPGSVYLEKKAEFEKKFKLTQNQVSAPATPEPATTEPTATVTAEVVSMPVQFETVIAKMRQLHKEQGNAGLEKILKKYGVEKVPQLNGVAPNDELVTAIDLAIAGKA